MHLEYTFAIPAGIDVAWAVFNDPARFAPCVPGSVLESSEGDSFTGTVRVKLATFALNYQGTGTYLRRDHAGYSVLIEVTGRDTRGNGTASAKLTGSLAADGPDRTRVTMITELIVTGRPAQFGRAMVAGVGDEMVGQFVSCLSRRLAPDGGASGSGVSGSGVSGSGGGPAAPRGSVPSTGAATAPPRPGAAGGRVGAPAAAVTGSMNGYGPRPAGGPVGAADDVDAVDLLGAPGAPGTPVAKRALPVFLALVLLFVVIRRIKSR